MTPAMEPIALDWWQWIAPLCVQTALLAVVLGILERSLSCRTPSSVRAAFTWAVWLRLWLPPGASSPLALARFVEGPWSSQPATADSNAPWSTALLAIWLFGVAVASVLTARSFARERAMWLAKAVSAGPRVQSLADAAAARLKLAATPRVLLLPGASGPAAVGVLRPRVVLPSDWAVKASEKELGHVLLHEFAHVARRDGIAAFAWTLARIVFWFHPLVHWTATRAATLREIGADERAASASQAVGDYRRTLLERARPLAARMRTGLAGFVPTGAQILARLDALERPARCSAAFARASAIGTFALLALCCVPLARRAPSDSTSFAELQGCLRKRYAVLAELAQQSAHDSNSPPTHSQKTRP